MIARRQLSVRSEAALLLGSTVIVNAGNYAINLLLGRWLGPAQFAEAGALATLVLILSFAAVGLQLAAAKFSATYVGRGESGQLTAFRAWIRRRTAWIAIGLSAALMLLTLPIANFLQFRSPWPLVIVFAGLPLYLLFSVGRGLMQGTGRFVAMAQTYQIEMWVRLAATFGLLMLIQSLAFELTSEAVAVGFLVSFGATFWLSETLETGAKNEPSNVRMPAFEAQPAFTRFILLIGLYECSQILINNSDVLMVKHFFSEQTAGLYAAVALIGRVVFFATWTIVTLLFPKVIEREQQGREHQSLFWASLAVVLGAGLLITGGCRLFDRDIIGLLFGPAYLEAAHLLWPYALATTLFASANVFAYYFLSIDRYLPVFLSLAAGGLQIGLIGLFHDSLTTVVWVQIGLMSALLTTMIAYFGFYVLKRQTT